MQIRGLSDPVVASDVEVLQQTRTLMVVWKDRLCQCTLNMPPTPVAGTSAGSIFHALEKSKHAAEVNAKIGDIVKHAAVWLKLFGSDLAGGNTTYLAFKKNEALDKPAQIVESYGCENHSTMHVEEVGRDVLGKKRVQDLHAASSLLRGGNIWVKTLINLPVTLEAGLEFRNFFRVACRDP